MPYGTIHTLIVHTNKQALLPPNLILYRFWFIHLPQNLWRLYSGKFPSLLKTPALTVWKGVLGRHRTLTTVTVWTDTWNWYDLHSVQQGRWNSSCGVGSSYKKDLGKVKGHIQIMICKVMVLFRIQHLGENKHLNMVVVAIKATKIKTYMIY